MLRALIGFVLSAGVALLARRVRALSTRGAFAAVAIGTAAVAAGWSWGALLVLYFVVASALSATGVARKATRTADVSAKDGTRDAMQVLANGGVFAVALLGLIATRDGSWAALALGSLAASSADTWSTEVGTLIGGEPRSILTGRVVPAGTSGGITFAGTVAAILGSCFIAGVALALHVVLGLSVRACAAVAVAGFAGAMFDSVLGASVQQRRWCAACAIVTERAVHRCGSPTRLVAGLRWLDNDGVNLVSNAVGGVLAVLLSR